VLGQKAKAVYRCGTGVVPRQILRLLATWAVAPMQEEEELYTCCFFRHWDTRACMLAAGGRAGRIRIFDIDNECCYMVCEGCFRLVATAADLLSAFEGLIPVTAVSLVNSATFCYVKPFVMGAAYLVVLLVLEQLAAPRADRLPPVEPWQSHMLQTRLNVAHRHSWGMGTRSTSSVCTLSTCASCCPQARCRQLTGSIACVMYMPDV
jgi:hypothetical protein